MTPEQMKTRRVSQSHYTTYLKKAKEFLDTMNASLNFRGWDAVGLNAAHCAISATDALLVHKAGIRSAGYLCRRRRTLDQLWGKEGKTASLKIFFFSTWQLTRTGK